MPLARAPAPALVVFQLESAVFCLGVIAVELHDPLGHGRRVDLATCEGRHDDSPRIGADRLDALGELFRVEVVLRRRLRL